MSTPPDISARILVVDDDEANRESLSRRLARRGYDVELAADGQAALDAVSACAATNAFDLILLDVMMPGMSGLEVLQALRLTQSAIELPVIMATARDESQDVVEALAMGASDYVTKPLDFAVVMARVQTQIALRRSIQRTLALEHHLSERNAELEHANGELLTAAKRAAQEMELASKVQATFLPRTPTLSVRSTRFAWRYEPCETLAGDALNVCMLDEEHVGFYVLDVSGHGVAASLNAVSAARLLAPGHDPDSILVDRAVVEPSASNLSKGNGHVAVAPAEVARRLSQRFVFTDDTAQFMTCFYAVLDQVRCKLSYVSAGHPGAILVRTGEPPRVLPGTGLPIGIGQEYEQQEVQLQPGDRVFMYSDGITEARSKGDEFFGTERLVALLASESGAVDAAGPLDAVLGRVINAIADWRGGAPPTDDVSLLVAECSAP